MPISGYYVITGTVTYSSPNSGDYYIVSISINGIQESATKAHASSTNIISISASDIRWLVVGDYIELRTYYNGVAASEQIYGSGADAYTFISISILS